MIYLSNTDVQHMLDMRMALEALRAGYGDLEKGDATYIPRIDLYAPTGRDVDYHRWGSMTGACRSYGVVAVRIKSDIVSWPNGKTEEKYCVSPGTYSGIILLYSSENGEPLAMINDGYLQHARVGAGAGLGTDYLARPDAKMLGLLGSGGMAGMYLEAISLVRKLERVKVFSPTKEHREHFAEEFTKRLGVPVEAMNTPEEAAYGVDILATATDTLLPIVKVDWLEQGMHIVNVSSQEISREVLERADIAVQLGMSTIRNAPPESGIEYCVGAMASYVAGQPDERARIPVSGQGREQHSYPMLVGEEAPRRTDPRQITLFLNSGTQGLQFAAVAGRVYREAVQRGIGQEMPREWFLQDIRD